MTTRAWIKNQHIHYRHICKIVRVFLDSGRGSVSSYVFDVTYKDTS